MRQDKQKKYAAAYGRTFARLGVQTFIFLALQTALHGGIYGTINFPDGSLSGIGGDRAWSTTPGLTCRLSGLVSDGKIQGLLDVRSAKTLDAILIVNATNAATKIHVDRAAIRVAADEHAPGFDYTDVASYTMLVFSNRVLPSVYSASTLREAVLNQRLKRRYYLIQATHNFWGALEVTGVPDVFEVRFHDITYRLAPPSGTVVLVR